MATPNPYIALYKADGYTRITEWDCPGHDTQFIEPAGYLLIPDGGSTESTPIPFTIKCADTFTTTGDTSLRLVNNIITKNRWRFSATTDFTNSTWGGDFIITSPITTTPKTLYIQARALGSVSNVPSTTADSIDADVSVHIAISTTIIKA